MIADEINTYKDSPADLIYDTFEDMLFAGSELGHNILGRKNALARYDGEAIRAFTGRTHTTDQMVFSSIGNFSAKPPKPSRHVISPGRRLRHAASAG